MRRVLAITAAVSLLSACTPDPEMERLKATTKATYDPQTGRLRLLTFDANKNGFIDTWTYMDGTRVLRSEIDANEDGTIDRWEYHDTRGKLEKVAVARAHDGKPDAWAYAGPDGQTARVEMSSARDEKRIDRWERYEKGVLVGSDDDANGDGKPEKWETWVNGRLATASFDENGDGRPDRRLTYDASGKLLTIESEPDATGIYTRRLVVGER